MIITWVTLDHINETLVEYGTGLINEVAIGTNQIFVDGGDERRKLTIHRVVLQNLLPGTYYSTIFN
jgi:hypothetical protein